MPAGETPYLAAKGLDGNVLQRDRPAGERVVPGKTGQADRTGGVATDVQAEPFVSAVFSRHSRKYRVVYRMLACGRVDARGQAVNTLTFQLDHSVGAGQPIAAIASRRWAPWRGVEEGQAQGVRRSEVPLVATPAGAARVAGLWVTEGTASSGCFSVPCCFQRRLRDTEYDMGYDTPGPRRRVSYPVSDSMSFIRRAKERGTENRSDTPAAVGPVFSSAT